MKEFTEFAEAVNLNSQMKKRSREALGAYHLTREEIYLAGYSVNGYAPEGKQKLTVLPLKMLLKDSFLQYKIFLFLCRIIKKEIRERLLEIEGSIAEIGEISESGLLGAVLICGFPYAPAIKYCLEIVVKEGIKNEREKLITYLIKEFSGYDLNSIK